MARLPEVPEQDWIRAQLAHLIYARGQGTFLQAPVLEPNDQFFPDPWTPDEHGARNVVRRLLVYAGLSHLTPVLTYFAGSSSAREFVNPSFIPSVHAKTAGWFAGIEGDRCSFGIDPAQIKDPDAFVGTLCHEVAHAYRHAHHLNVTDRDEEERRTDLTAVYLGFGVLVTNNAFRYRTSGGHGHQRWSHQQIGYLSPEAFGFAFALQGVARGWSGSRRRRFRGFLETTQAAIFDTAFRQLSKEVPSLRLELGVHEERERPDDRPIAAPLWDELHAPPVERELLDEVIAPGVVWRVLERRSHLRAVGAAAVGFGAGVFVVVLVATWIDQKLNVALGASMAVSGAVGAWFVGRLGWAKPVDYCSDSRCKSPLDEAAAICPRCRRRIAGAIENPNQRLALEDEMDSNTEPESDSNQAGM